MGQESSSRPCGSLAAHTTKRKAGNPHTALRHECSGLAAAPLTCAAAVLPTVKIVKKDLALAILEIGSNLPDIADIHVEEIGISDIGEEIVLEGLPEADPADTDEFMHQILDLSIGDWLELIDEQHHRRRIKLCWKSLVTSLYVFVNFKGIKVAAISIDDLAERLRQGKARII